MRNKTYWLIGASAGIGEALAHALAQEGARLVLSARSEQALEELRAALPGAGHRAIALDVTDEESIAAAHEQAGDFHGLIYCAGFYEPMNAREADGQALLKMVDVNFTGLCRVLNAALPGIIARGKGHIVLFGSLSGYRGLPDAYGYGATKAAAMSLAESLKADLRKSDIKVQCVNPGFVKTRLTDKNDFKMPFIIEPEDAAARIVKGMKGGAPAIAFPKRFATLFWILELLPARLYHWLLRTFA